MATYTVTITTGSDDYDWNSTSATRLDSSDNRTVNPPTGGPMNFLFDTSVIPTTEKVQTLTLRINELSYSATRGLAKTYQVRILNQVDIIQEGTSAITYLGFGNRNITLPTKFFPWVEKGGNDTKIEIDVSECKTNQFRQFKVEAYENSGSSPAQLTITTTSAERCRVWFSGG